MFVRTVLLIFALALSGSAQKSSDVSVGLFPFLVGNMDSQIQTVVNDCVLRHVDTLYVSVFRTSGPNAGELWVDDAPGTWPASRGPIRSGGKGIDLQRLITAAHLQNLRVVAVIKCFSATVSPDSAAHKQYLLDIIDYLVHSYDASGKPYFDLDGVALDYIRYVGSGLGHSHHAVTNFLKDVRDHLGALSLHCYLIANRYTFDGPAYNLSFSSYTSVRNSLESQFGQNWEQMARYTDVMMPMTYTANGSIYSSHAQHKAYVKQAAGYCRNACIFAGVVRRVTPVIKTYSSSNETTTAQTVEASIEGALAGTADGYQAFRYNTMRLQSTWWAKMAQYAVPGANFPKPSFTASANRLSGLIDASASTDFDEPSANLKYRVDLHNDGQFETAWLPNLPTSVLLNHTGRFEAAVQVRDSQGHVSTTVRRFVGGTVFSSSHAILQSFTGGSVRLDLDCGPLAKGASYLVLASLSGSGTGTQWTPELRLPLALDSFSMVILSATNTPLLQNGAGKLDSLGRGSAVFSVPPGVLGALAYKRITWAALAADGAGQPLFVTNAASFLILP